MCSTRPVSCECHVTSRVGQCVRVQHVFHQEGGIEGASSGRSGVSPDSHGRCYAQGVCMCVCVCV